MQLRSASVAFALATALTLSACGGDDATSTSDTSAATDTAGGGTASTTTGSSTFDVNSADQDEIAAVLDAAGVPSADQWAREVVEYRPYDLTDANMTHLRDELAKYNPSAEVVDQIVAALQA